MNMQFPLTSLTEKLHVTPLPLPLSFHFSSSFWSKEVWKDCGPRASMPLLPSSRTRAHLQVTDNLQATSPTVLAYALLGMGDASLHAPSPSFLASSPVSGCCVAVSWLPSPPSDLQASAGSALLYHGFLAGLIQLPSFKSTHMLMLPGLDLAPNSTLRAKSLPRQVSNSISNLTRPRVSP